MVLSEVGQRPVSDVPRPCRRPVNFRGGVYRVPVVSDLSISIPLPEHHHRIFVTHFRSLRTKTKHQMHRASYSSSDRDRDPLQQSVQAARPSAIWGVVGRRASGGSSVSGHLLQQTPQTCPAKAIDICEDVHQLPPRRFNQERVSVPHQPVSSALRSALSSETRPDLPLERGRSHSASSRIATPTPTQRRISAPLRASPQKLFKGDIWGKEEVTEAPSEMDAIRAQLEQIPVVFAELTCRVAEVESRCLGLQEELRRERGERERVEACLSAQGDAMLRDKGYLLWTVASLLSRVNESSNVVLQRRYFKKFAALLRHRRKFALLSGMAHTAFPHHNIIAHPTPIQSRSTLSNQPWSRSIIFRFHTLYRKNSLVLLRRSFRVWSLLHPTRKVGGAGGTGGRTWRQLLKQAERLHLRCRWGAWVRHHAQVGVFSAVVAETHKVLDERQTQWEAQVHTAGAGLDARMQRVLEATSAQYRSVMSYIADRSTASDAALCTLWETLRAPPGGHAPTKGGGGGVVSEPRAAPFEGPLRRG